MNNRIKLLAISLMAISIYACKTPTPVVVADEFVSLDTIEIDANRELDIYRASEKRVNDLLHTKLEVSFDWDSAYLNGKAHLSFTPYFYPTDELVLDAKGFQIHEVSLVDSIGKKSPLKYEYDQEFLTIDLGKTYSRLDTYDLFIDYTAMPNKLKESGSAAITSEKGLYFINPDGSDPNKPKQIWTQGETESSSCWFPTIDAPNERTTQEIYITVDSNYTTLSNGELIFQTENEDGTRTDYWKQKLSHAPYLFMMTIGEFAVVEDSWRDIPVNYYVEPKYEAYAKDIYPNTPEMIEFFSKKMGYDYPWDKYHQIVVRDYVSGAMENTGAVIYGTFVQGNSRFLIDNSGEDIVAHELFHHWFGDLVTLESWSNLPLNESFATYGEYLWNEYKYGKDQADLHGDNDMSLYISQSRINKKHLIRFNYDRRTDMFDTHSYQKGGRVLHMLRQYVGDEAFFESLSLYLHRHAFQTVEIHQLRLAFEKVTGEDLNWFFNQWFLGAGHPIIEISQNYIDSTESIIVEVKQTQEGEGIAEIFQIPTKIGIVKADGSLHIEEVWINQRKQEIIIPLDAAPQMVNFDWDKTLLGEVDQDIPKSQAIVRYQNANHYSDKIAALKMVKSKRDSASLDLIAKGLDDDFWHVRKQAISYIKRLAQNRSEFTLAKLKELAAKDEKSQVRRAAYAAIDKHFEEEIEIAFLEKGIQDSSYLVNSVCLNAIYNKDSEKGLLLAKELEGEESNSITLGIANIYAEDGNPEANSFFQEKIKTASGFNKYGLINNYGLYLEKQSDEVVNEAIPLLEDIGLNANSWFLRMAPVNAMVKLKNNHKKLVSEITEKLPTTTDQAEIDKMKNESDAAKTLSEKINASLIKINEVEVNKNLKKILEKAID